MKYSLTVKQYLNSKKTKQIIISLQTTCNSISSVYNLNVPKYNMKNMEHLKIKTFSLKNIRNIIYLPKQIE